MRGDSDGSGSLQTSLLGVGATGRGPDDSLISAHIHAPPPRELPRMPIQAAVAKPKLSDERQQLYFLFLFLLGSIADTISTSLESGYISHIKPCLDSSNITCINHTQCVGEHTASGIEHVTNITCSELINITAGCDAEVPAWAVPCAAPGTSAQHDHGAASHPAAGGQGGLIKTWCRSACGECTESAANRNAPAQLAAYSMVESMLGWFGRLNTMWGGLSASKVSGLTVKIGTHVGAQDDESVGKELKMAFISCFGAAAIAWGVIYPFGPAIVKAAFNPEHDVFYCAFVHDRPTLHADVHPTM
eukprot:COSAG01_NODE_7476_length_3195_cov_4.496770_4_plen_303_part_00